MTWLTPLPALIAAGIVIPALVALYFLKLKRQEAFVPTTLLWKRAVQDLQVNAPFQRLRKNLLLLIQLLILAAVLCALGQPVLSLDRGQSRRYVIMIDRSASMNTKEANTTRLDQAKDQAKQLVENMRQRGAFSMTGAADQAMVVAFDKSARVMCTFTDDKRQLAAAIDSIPGGDGQSMLGEALTVARASATPREAANNRSSEIPPTMELFSDGRIADAYQQTLANEEFNYHRIGEAADNVAVTALQARRSYEKPAEVEVFAALSNYNQAAITCSLELRLDGNIRSVKQVQVPGLRPAAGTQPEAPGQVSVTFGFNDDAGGVLEVRQLRKDALACDDSAWIILPPPRQLAVLLVTSGNLPLQAVLKACPLQKLDVKTPAEFDKLASDEAALAAAYNLVVLDRYAPAKLPRGRYIMFDATPPGMDVSSGDQMKDQLVVDWRSRHPVLQNVNLAGLYVTKPRKLTLPRDAEVLAEFGQSPAIALLRKAGTTVLLVGFDVMDTNWPFEPGFVMFLYNATGYLGMEDQQDTAPALKVGDPITAAGFPPGLEADISGPGTSSLRIFADPSGTLRFPGTGLAGLYTLTPQDRPLRRFAVNILDDKESHIAPAASVDLSGTIVAAQEGVTRKGNLEIWPYLAMAALVLACLEWFVYNSRARL